MTIHLQTYVSFIICSIVLYLTFSDNAFCYGREGNYLSQLTSSLVKHNSTKASVFNVLNFGAKGDGVTNDAVAFMKTWDTTCQTNGGVMLVPSRYSFLLQPVIFNGSSCKSRITVQVYGTIVAPSDKSHWSTKVYEWIKFTGMGNGLTIEGNGVIDGKGKSWWTTYIDNGSDESNYRPHALGIKESTAVDITGVNVQNAPRMHIYIGNSQYVRIFNVTVSSPGESPNTDGIHLSNVQHAEIYDSHLACGDDCVSIQTGSYDVYIHNVNCGPGHGFSIGGLAPHKTKAQVSDITVYSSTLSNSLYGVRIKTWPDGYGSVHNITFSGITMTGVHNPIVIDQNYCGGGSHRCPPETANAVAISGVRYEGIRGTYTETSVSLVCSKHKSCRGLTFSSINLTPSASLKAPKPNPYCFNAYGRLLTATLPPLTNCLLPEVANSKSYPPAMAPI